MQQPEWLPAELAESSFSNRTAAELGVSPGRRDSAALQRPFTGVRAAHVATDPLTRAHDYAPRLRQRQAFSGVTALRLHGLPWVRPWHLNETVEIAVPGRGYPPRSKGVRGHRVAEHRFMTTLVEGMPVLTPAAAVMTVAERLGLEDLTAVLDAMLTHSQWYQGLRHRPLVASVSDLRQAVDLWGPSPARTRILPALDLARPGVDSFQESVTRVLLVRAGLPEPVVQVPVHTRSGTRLADGGWPDYRVCFEYEGEHHRLDRVQWQRDIRRDEDFALAGWSRIRVTADALVPQHRAALIARVRSALQQRGWRP